MDIEKNAPTRNELEATPDPLTDTDTAIGDHAITIQVQYNAAGTYDSYQTSHAKTFTLTVTLASLCLASPTSWEQADGSPPVSVYSITVGETLRVAINTVVDISVNFPDSSVPDACMPDFYDITQTDAAGNASTVFTTFQRANDSGLSDDFIFEARSDSIDDVDKVFTLTATQRYRYYPTHTDSSIVSTQAFTVTILEPDCNVDWPISRAAPMVSPLVVYIGDTKEVIVDHFTTPSAPPSYCGSIVYEFSTTDTAGADYVFDSAFESNKLKLTITVNGSDRDHYLANPNAYSYTITARHENGISQDQSPGYDAAAPFHDSEVVALQFESYCATENIEQASGADSTMSEYVLTTSVTATIASFTSLATDGLAAECAMTHTLTSSDSVFVPTFDVSTSVLTVGDLLESQIGTYTITIEVSYEHYPLEPTVVYTFTYEVKSICLRDALTVTGSDTTILAQQEVQRGASSPLVVSLAQLWSNEGITNSQTDCAYGYRVADYSEVISFSQTEVEYDSDDVTATFATSDWSMVSATPWTTTLEIYFVNYEPAVTRASETISFTVITNCASDPITWVSQPTSSTVHVGAYNEHTF